MKILPYLIAFSLIPIFVAAQDDQPLLESKAAAERAFDAVISVENRAPTNEDLNKGLSDAIDEMIDNLDELKDAKKIKALRAMKKHIDDNASDDPAKSLDGAAKAAKKAVSTGDKIEDAGINDYIDKVKRGLSSSVSNQISDLLTVSARGTGRTTGHIADLSITNTGNQAVVTIPQTFFIPSEGRFQSYVGRTPGGTHIPPGETVAEPVDGYCTDVTRPPVTSGEPMPPPEDWVPVKEGGSDGTDRIPVINPVPNASDDPATPVAPMPSTPQDPFEPDDIPGIESTPGFTSTPPPEDTDSTFPATYPGTDTPISGTIDVDKNPKTFGPLVVEVVTRIEDAVPIIQARPDISTPMSTNPDKEKESITQQSVWIAMGVITGKDYNKDDFADNVYQQFESSTGQPVTSLEEKDKEKVDAGVDAFWDAFTATGVEAKVLSVPHMDEIEESLGNDISDVKTHTDSAKQAADAAGAKGYATGNTVETHPQSPVAEEVAHAQQLETQQADEGQAEGTGQEETEEDEEQRECTCNSLSFDVSRNIGGRYSIIASAETDEFESSKSKRVEYDEAIEFDADAFGELKLKVENITVDCSCDAETPCQFYMSDDYASETPQTVEIEVEGQGATISDEDGNGKEQTFTAKTKNDNYYLYVKIKAFCSSEDCEETKCIRWFRWQFKKAKTE